MSKDPRVVRIPSPILDQRRKLKQIEGALRVTGSIEQTPSALIERLGLERHEADDLQRSLAPEVSSQETLGRAEGLTIEETLAADDDETHLEDFDRSAIGRRLREVIPTLSEREQHVLTSRYGLTNAEPRTLAEIGRELGVSRERIRQIERQALEHLRENDVTRALAVETGVL